MCKAHMLQRVLLGVCVHGEEGEVSKNSMVEAGEMRLGPDWERYPLSRF